MALALAMLVSAAMLGLLMPAAAASARSLQQACQKTNVTGTGSLKCYVGDMIGPATPVNSLPAIPPTPYISVNQTVNVTGNLLGVPFKCPNAGSAQFFVKVMNGCSSAYALMQAICRSTQKPSLSCNQSSVFCEPGLPIPLSVFGCTPVAAAEGAAGLTTLSYVTGTATCPSTRGNKVQLKVIAKNAVGCTSDVQVPVTATATPCKGTPVLFSVADNGNCLRTWRDQSALWNLGFTFSVAQTLLDGGLADTIIGGPSPIPVSRTTPPDPYGGGVPGLPMLSAYRYFTSSGSCDFIGTQFAADYPWSRGATQLYLTLPAKTSAAIVVVVPASSFVTPPYNATVSATELGGNTVSLTQMLTVPNPFVKDRGEKLFGFYVKNGTLAYLTITVPVGFVSFAQLSVSTDRRFCTT